MHAMAIEVDRELRELSLEIVRCLEENMIADFPSDRAD
jgi:hypothetical protein